MAHGGNQQEQSPENPAHPVKDSGNDEHERQDFGDSAVQAGREA